MELDEIEEILEGGTLSIQITKEPHEKASVHVHGNMVGLAFLLAIAMRKDRMFRATVESALQSIDSMGDIYDRLEAAGGIKFLDPN